MVEWSHSSQYTVWVESIEFSSVCFVFEIIATTAAVTKLAGHTLTIISKMTFVCHFWGVDNRCVSVLNERRIFDNSVFTKFSKFSLFTSFLYRFPISRCFLPFLTFHFRLVWRWLTKERTKAGIPHWICCWWLIGSAAIFVYTKWKAMFKLSACFFSFGRTKLNTM